MKAFNRRNLEGEIFCLVEMDEGRTLIRLLHDGTKCIVVNKPVSQVIMAWHEWTKGGSFIEYAFDFLSNSQRRFIETAVTVGEYERLYTE